MSQGPKLKTVLSLSTQTVAGMVGNRVTMFVLQRMGHRVRAVPTSLNSNHGGYSKTFHEPVDVQTMEGLIGNLEENGWLDETDAVFTGCFLTPEQVQLAERWIKRMQRAKPDLLYFCDPILGDDAPPGYPAESGGVYVGHEVAQAVSETLVPLADFTTPNRFELEYLSGQPVTSLEDALEAASYLAPANVLATSIPCGDDELSVVCISPDGHWCVNHARLDDVPKGTGDVFAASALGALLNGAVPPAALEFATTRTFAFCQQSLGQQELQILAHQNLFDVSV